MPWQLPGHVTQGRGLHTSLALPLALGTLPVPKACSAPGTAREEEAVMQTITIFLSFKGATPREKWTVPSPAAS